MFVFEGGGAGPLVIDFVVCRTALVDRLYESLHRLKANQTYPCRNFPRYVPNINIDDNKAYFDSSVDGILDVAV